MSIIIGSDDLSILNTLQVFQKKFKTVYILYKIWMEQTKQVRRTHFACWRLVDRALGEIAAALLRKIEKRLLTIEKMDLKSQEVSLHSVYRFEGETSPLQERLDSNSRGEGTSTSYFAQLGSVVRSILRVGKRKRILHDIIPGNVDELNNYFSIIKDTRKSLSRRILYPCQAIQKRLGTSPCCPRLQLLQFLM